MDYVLYSIAMLAISLFVLLALVNLYICISSLLNSGKGHVSMFPFVGGFFGCIGFALLPSLRFYAWLPLFLDASIISLLYSLPIVAYQTWQTSSLNLIAEYVALTEDRKVKIRLFKQHIFTLKYQVNRQPNEVGLVELNTVGNWLEDAETLKLGIDSTQIIFEKAFSDGKEMLRLISGFEKYLSDLIFTKTQV